MDSLPSPLDTAAPEGAANEVDADREYVEHESGPECFEADGDASLDAWSLIPSDGMTEERKYYAQVESSGDDHIPDSSRDGHDAA